MRLPRSLGSTSMSASTNTNLHLSYTLTHRVTFDLQRASCRGGTSKVTQQADAASSTLVITTCAIFPDRPAETALAGERCPHEKLREAQDDGVVGMGELRTEFRPAIATVAPGKFVSARSTPSESLFRSTKSLSTRSLTMQSATSNVLVDSNNKKLQLDACPTQMGVGHTGGLMFYLDSPAS